MTFTSRTWALALTGLALTGAAAYGAATPAAIRAAPAGRAEAAQSVVKIVGVMRGSVGTSIYPDNLHGCCEGALPARQAATSWHLEWSPQANVGGLNAFEGVENLGRTKEIYVKGDDFHVGMNVADREGTDRQRNEVKGMRTPAGAIITIGKGETWRFTYSMYMPSSLRATTSFTHIMQMKMPGTGSAPIATLDLRRAGAASRLQLVVFKTNTVIGSTDLLPLQNKWITIDVRFRYDDAPNGWAQIIVNNGAKTVLNAQKSGVDTWLGDRVRPKWGIYRSISDSADLRDTYLLLTGMRAYRLQ